MREKKKIEIEVFEFCSTRLATFKKKLDFSIFTKVKISNYRDFKI